MSVEPQRILVVDDEADFARGLVRLLDAEFPAARAEAAGSGEEGLRALAERGADLVLTDLRMPGMDGLAFLALALAREPQLTVVMLTAHGSIETAVQAVREGAYDFLTKPVSGADLFRVVGKGLERSRLVAENRRLQGLLAGQRQTLVGTSPAMHRLRQAIAAVARADYPVLVRGESGAGKELVVRLIHASSPRSARPLVAVNCPAVPENLMESELFGHVKGAFTGADRDRQGLFAAADGGVLHLDEIGDISPGVQTKLLRVLQEREVRPVGSGKTLRVDARVVASTNQDLEAKIAAHAFREDLYYRLNVLTVNVPPLRERVEDIPLLAQHFLGQAAKEMGAPGKAASPEVLAWLAGRDWPGNVRELQNFMRRLAVFCPEPEVTMRWVSMAASGACPGPADHGARLSAYKDAKARVVDQFTAGYVRELLRSCKGNISEVARVSGLSRVAVQKILGRLGLDPRHFRSD
ncbi:MAG: sigma-54 dependent transcriptional regulator [Thermodesulfobacteriota bacterium]